MSFIKVDTSDASINGTVAVTSIDVDASGEVASNGSVTVDEISGAGSMNFIANGKLFVDSGIKDNPKLSDTTLTVGMVIFKATSDAAVEDFESYGYTAELVVGDKIGF